MRLILVRHSQTDWNREHRLHGMIDIPLNSTGIQQSTAVGEALLGRSITRIYCSDLLRSKQTAETIGSILSIDVHVREQLRECSFGSLEGMLTQEFLTRCGEKNHPGYPHVLEADFTPFGGDRCADIFTKHKELLDELAQEIREETILIVGHGRSLRTVLVTLGYPTLFPEQGSFVEIEYPVYSGSA